MINYLTESSTKRLVRESSFELLANSSNDIIIVISNSSTICFVNIAGINFFNLNYNHVIGENLSKVLSFIGLESPVSLDYFKCPKKETKVVNQLSWELIPTLEKGMHCPDLMLIGKPLLNHNENVQKTLDQIINCTPGSLYWKDRAGKYLGCNLFMVQTAGLNSVYNVVGKTDIDLWPQAAKKIYENDQKVIDSGETIFLEEEIKVGNENMYFTGVKMPLKNENGDIVGVIGNSLDITKLKQTQIELKIAKETAESIGKSETELRKAVMILTGSIVHDLRTWITIVGMAGDSIQTYFPALLNGYQKAKDASLIPEEDQISDNQLKALEKILPSVEQTAKDMDDFVNSTLKTLSAALKNENRELSECSMHQCIHKTLTRYPFLTDQADLVKWDRADFKFMGNELLMIRVIFNLINNSLQQIKNNSAGEIFITTERRDNSNILRFKDTAGGVSTEVLSHLFVGYLTTKQEGTGIGLAFCKITMESFNGSITCNSIHGDYIEFELSFPGIIE